MKIRNRIRMIPIMLAMALLFSLSVSAALPPSVEIQWVNTKKVTCEVIITGNLGTVSASITGNTGTTVQATATLYEIINGISTVIYTESTPTPNPLPIASFTEDFTARSGATYYLIMNGVVSKNGVDEEINRSDVETIP